MFQLKPDYVTNYESWDEYMGWVWASLFKYLKLPERATVIEIAPGNSQKIGLALKNCCFAGKLYIVEPFEECLSALCKSYADLLPLAKIYPIQHKLHDASNHLPIYPDFVISNHPMDDMLIAFKQSFISPLFNWSLHGSDQLSTLFVQYWNKLSEEPAVIASIKKSIVQEWQECFNLLKPKTIIISQYPSMVLKKMGLNALNKHAGDMLEELKEFLPCENTIQPLLNQINSFNDYHIEHEVLNEKNWLVHKK